MGKVGRFVTDPKVGVYCQIVLDSREKIVVNHDKGGVEGGRLTIEAVKFMGFGSDRILALALDSPEGEAALLARWVARHPEVLTVVRGADGRGVDAVLVQDLGLVRLIREICPDLPIHASTQMTLTSSQSIAAALELGAIRVVLARECSLDEIRRI